MSLIGDCEDCGAGAQLRYKPDVPHSEQSRPSVCPHCHDRREARVEEFRTDEPLPARYDPGRLEREIVDPTEESA
ncbi:MULTISPECIES: hypothetical protein [Bacillati]|uniref:Small CPxCG-related zinc finger protein n=3 Tax=Bacillati TaxID=1783272 RepID=A0ABN3UYR1_9ACTN